MSSSTIELVRGRVRVSPTIAPARGRLPSSLVRIDGLPSQIRKAVVIRTQSASAQILGVAQLSADMVRGQVCYIVDGVAYPATNALLAAVLGLLGVIDQAGSAGATRKAVLVGDFDDPIFNLLPGRVFLGADGFPTSSDPGTGNYVPIGDSQGGTSFLFSPRERFVR